MLEINTDTFGKVAKEETANNDIISKPSHYIEGRKYEPRKVIEDWGLDWNLGNTVKYISRAGRKGPAVDDLKKAAQYLQWEIEKLEENTDTFWKP